MAARSKQWAALVANWAALETSQKHYDLMQRILKEARTAA
jgi:hypothetical protein